MNEKLKFSWGHIIAFIALIALSYISFVGYTYLTDGNFYFALAAAVATDIVFLLIFLGAQFMKGSGTQIRKKLIWERILVFSSPLIFAGCLVGFAHFWTIKTQNDELVEKFKRAVNNSKQMFSDYETYSQKRLNDYEKTLNKIIVEKKTNPKRFREAGFEAGKEEFQKTNMIEILRLQLLSDNYERLKKEATDWIQKANDGASTWNVFLIGNIHNINDAIRDWDSTLKSFAENKMKNESLISAPEEFSSSGYRSASSGFQEMTETFKKGEFPVWQTIIIGLIIYFFLLLPYIIQQRHGRQVAMGYRLFKFGKGPVSDPLEMDNKGVRITYEKPTTEKVSSEEKGSDNQFNNRPSGGKFGKITIE